MTDGNGRSALLLLTSGWLELPDELIRDAGLDGYRRGMKPLDPRPEYAGDISNSTSSEK